MKKILGISLCALFAVSAANAEIASKDYVDRLNNNLGARVTTNENNISANTTAIGNNASDITALGGRVTANEGAITGINNTITGMNFTGTTGQFVTGVSQSGGTVTATGADFADEVTANGEIAPTSAAVATHVEGAINALDVDATSGQFVTRISQVDGKISAGSGSFAGDVTTGGTTAPTSNAVVTYVAGAITDATGELGALAHKDKVATGDIDAGAIMNADINANAEIASSKIKFTDTQNTVFGSGIDSTKVGQIATNTTNIATNKTNITNLTTRVAANETAITGIQGDIGNMDLTETGGNYVKKVKQLDGTVTATAGEFEANFNAETTDNAPTSKAVATYVEGKITGVTTRLGELAYQDTVAEADIDANAVTTAKIADDAVTTAKIATGAVTDDGLATNAVTSTKIANDTIVDADINASANIATSKIAFTDRQENALNSGITSGLVTQIGTNQTNIRNNTTSISTNKTNIDTIMGYLTPEGVECGEHGCTLVFDGESYKWEKISR